MAHVILAILLIAPMSLYDLVKAFEAGVAHFYSASSGSIKRALDGLLASGFIEVASEEPDARRRKVYRATEAGRHEFHRWMTGKLVGSNIETAALSRLHFLGLLEPAERGPALDGILERIEQELASLETVERELNTMQPPPELQEVFVHQRGTLDYGLASARFARDWFRDYRERLDAPLSGGAAHDD